MKKLTVLGSINADHIISVPYFAKPGETLTGSHYTVVYGGKGANQAVAAARAGGEVSFIGCIGADNIGQAMKQAFCQEGIDTQAIEVIPEQRTGVAMIQVNAQGENNIVIASGANAALTAKAVSQYKSVICQGDYLLMQLETPIPAIIQAASYAKAAQTKVVLNPAPATTLPLELLELVDIITPNETETALLTGITVKDQESANQAAAVFHQWGIECVIITLGAKGIYVSQQGQGQFIAGFKVQAQDSTAAGDTFNGALMVALCEQQPLLSALRFAQAAAAISVTRTGAQPSIPQRAEILAFLQQQTN
ncbi:ribokinase [Volucribacter amazonae]|uniref:Ribokinase n=1 Tax=Volucribacter amazonae TaxID=256731 RepID=A0A9X4SIC9_9PAST|nr:ribokinase [Volucribacter amazonae]MDG6895485.1 ribokinase [Volucribacter amazonae]